VVLVLLRIGDASQLVRRAVLAASPESNHGPVFDTVMTSPASHHVGAMHAASSRPCSTVCFVSFFVIRDAVLQSAEGRACNVSRNSSIQPWRLRAVHETNRSPIGAGVSILIFANLRGTARDSVNSASSEHMFASDDLIAPLNLRAKTSYCHEQQVQNVAQSQSTVEAEVGIDRHRCAGAFRITIPPLTITVFTGVLTVGDLCR
jgi:hypothetical protein